LVSKEKTPAGFVTSNHLFAEKGFRRGVVRVYGFEDPVKQNAAVMVTAERLSREIPDDFFFLPQRVESLDSSQLWAGLVASQAVQSQKVRQALLGSA